VSRRVGRTDAVPSGSRARTVSRRTVTPRGGTALVRVNFFASPRRLAAGRPQRAHGWPPAAGGFRPGIARIRQSESRKPSSYTTARLPRTRAEERPPRRDRRQFRGDREIPAKGHFWGISCRMKADYASGSIFKPVIMIYFELAPSRETSPAWATAVRHLTRLIGLPARMHYLRLQQALCQERVP
jgi:hypothetical protein